MNNFRKLREATASEYVAKHKVNDERKSLKPKNTNDEKIKKFHTITKKGHPTAAEHQYTSNKKAHAHKGGDKQAPGETSFLKFRAAMKENVILEKEDITEVEISHERYMRSHAKKAKDPGYSASWLFTHKQYGTPAKDEIFTHHGRLEDAKKHAKKWAKDKGHHAAYIMETIDYFIEEVSAGNLTLKTGETVKLSKSDAEKINEVLTSLSNENKKQMEKELLQSSSSFNKILNFARKASE